MRLTIDDLGLVPGRRGRALRDFVSAGIGAVGNIIAGSNASNAATKAAKIQADAAAAAGKQVVDTTAATNPLITAAADKSAAGVTDAATKGATGITDAATAAGAGATTAAKTANDFLNPYATAGSTAAEGLSKGVAAGGQFNNGGPTLDQLQMDPGYAFRLQQGQIALDRSAAARGGVTSGGNIKAQTDYAQGSASQEYKNAFDRFETNRQNNYTDLLGVSGQGQTAATRQGGNVTDASQYSGTAGLTGASIGGQMGLTGAQVAGGFTNSAADLTAANTIGAVKTAGDYMTSGAAASAGGVLGAAKGVNSGISGAIDSVGTALSLKKLLANPALPKTNPTNSSWGASADEAP
jgi:hypothetical protein